jgi:hypothetical protein
VPPLGLAAYARAERLAPEDAAPRYAEYRRRVLGGFYEAHMAEPWFRARYDPVCKLVDANAIARECAAAAAAAAALPQYIVQLLLMQQQQQQAQ